MIPEFVNNVRLFVENETNLSLKEKDFLTLELIVVTIAMLGLFANIGLSIVLKFLSDFFQIIIVIKLNIESLLDSMSSNSQYIEMYRFEPSFDMMLDFSLTIRLFIFILIPPIVSYLLYKFLKKSSGKLMMIYIFLHSIFLCLIFENTWKFMLCISAFLFVTVTIIPIGRGKYLDVLKYTEYYLDVFKEYPINLKGMLSKKGFYFFSKIFVSWLFFTMTLQILFPLLTTEIIVLISLSLVLLIFMNTSNSMSKIIKKAIIYSFFIPIVLLGNNTSQNEIFSVLVLFITVFFAFERVISLSKELKNIIREYSIMYYIEEGTNEIKKSTSLMFPTSYFYDEGYSEIEIVRQLVYCHKMGKNSEFKELYEIYKNSSFKDYLFLLKSLNYYLIFEDTELNKRYRYLKELFEIQQQQKIGYIPISFEYASVIYCKNKNYKLIISLLNQYEYMLDERMKKILNEAREKTEKM